MKKNLHSGLLVRLGGLLLVGWTISFLALFGHQPIALSQSTRKLTLEEWKVALRPNAQYHALFVGDTSVKREASSIVGNILESSAITWKNFCESIHQSSTVDCHENDEEDQSEPAIHHYFGGEKGPSATYMALKAFHHLSSTHNGRSMSTRFRHAPHADYVILDKQIAPALLPTASLDVKKSLQYAKEMIEDQGFVVWRSSTDNATASSELIDQEALNWTYRMPNVLYVPPTGSLSSILEHYAIHKSERIFLLTGAIRTLNYTQESLLQNFILQLCPVGTCQAHVVTHFSYSDNRPIRGKASDPRGQAISSSRTSNFTLFENERDFVIHKVPGYDIGSREEQDAMDLYERECLDTNLARRMHLIRRGDPRRYSMWFARAWAWRYVQNTFSFENVDLIAFARPDLLWMLPVPSFEFFNDFGTNPENEVWVHDSYFASVPDTFALFRSRRAANLYFDLKTLVAPDVACLGGPNFNETLVKQRLESDSIPTSTEDWCATRDSRKFGWSEKILKRRLASANLTVRFFPAAVTILRPPNQPLCFPLSPDTLFEEVEHQESYIPAAACKVALLKLKRNEYISSILTSRPFRFHHRHNENLCLALNDTTRIVSPTSCKYPIPIEQLFVKSDQGPLMGYFEDYSRERMIQVEGSFPNPGEWSRELAELYGVDTLVSVEREIIEDESESKD